MAGNASEPEKRVYLSLLLHGNMCYDRYTKQQIRRDFPAIYGAALRAMARFPEVTAHIDFPGLTWLSLRRYAPWFMDLLRPLVARGQVVVVGCQYAASHAVCSEEEADVVAGRLTMELLRRDLGDRVTAYFPQEIAFHPQMPTVMGRIGARRLVVMPEGWTGPRRVAGLDGSVVDVYPMDVGAAHGGSLEALYDRQPDGGFVMAGGDFEQMGSLEALVRHIEALAARGKRLEWTTVDRYDREVGVHAACTAPGPFGQAAEDQPASPSFSRWVSHPEDPGWHAACVEGADALRSASFAAACADLHGLGRVDAPLAEAWATPTDNPWDTRFEVAEEFPEAEAGFLAPGGAPTLLSRAWHHLLIGMNSDASGWFPWSPRTRHRLGVLRSSAGLSGEMLERFGQALGGRLRRPATEAGAWVAALNPMVARAAMVTWPTPWPATFIDARGEPLPTEAACVDGQWRAAARIGLPAYGYRMLGLRPVPPPRPVGWTDGAAVAAPGMAADLEGGRPRLRLGSREFTVDLAPFRLSDPGGAAPDEEARLDWSAASARVRTGALGPQLEVLCEAAWAVWLRLVIGLGPDGIDLTAEVNLDLPRRIGGHGRSDYDPEGLLLEVRGQPGLGFYDIPFGTIRHPEPGPSFVAAQRMAGLEADGAGWALVARGGDQSFRLSAAEGVVAAGLGASIQGRADTRPRCVLHADGTAAHLIASGGDPFAGSYTHRYTLIAGGPAEAAAAARRLRTAAPVVRVEPGGGPWPAAATLLEAWPEALHATGFHRAGDRWEAALNETAGRPAEAPGPGGAVRLPAYGSAMLPLRAADPG